jgi:hypothetical protein
VNNQEIEKSALCSKAGVSSKVWEQEKGEKKSQSIMTTSLPYRETITWSTASNYKY